MYCLVWTFFFQRKKRKGNEQQTTEDEKELAQPACENTYEKETGVELRLKMDLKAKKPEKVTKEVEKHQHNDEAKIVIKDESEVAEVVTREKSVDKVRLEKDLEKRTTGDGTEPKHKKSLILKLKLDSDRISRKDEVEAKNVITSAEKTVRKEGMEVKKAPINSEKGAQKDESELKRFLIKVPSDAAKDQASGPVSPSVQTSSSTVS